MTSSIHVEHPPFNSIVVTKLSWLHSDSDKEVEFINIHLPYNKLSLQFFANNAITCLKKYCVDDIKDKTTKASKTNTTQEKKVLVKRVGKKSSKASVLISRLVEHPILDIETLFMKTNIIIPTLHLF